MLEMLERMDLFGEHTQMSSQSRNYQSETLDILKAQSFWVGGVSVRKHVCINGKFVTIN